MDVYYKLSKKLRRLMAVHAFYIRKVSVSNALGFGQYPILETLMKNDALTQKELADMLNISKPAVTMSIKRMQKSGLIEKRASKLDQRAVIISITDKGRVIAEKCKRDFCLIDKKMFDGFSVEELKFLEGIIDRLIINLDDDDIRNKKLSELMHMNIKKGEDA